MRRCVPETVASRRNGSGLTCGDRGGTLVHGQLERRAALPERRAVGGDELDVAARPTELRRRNAREAPFERRSLDHRGALAK